MRNKFLLLPLAAIGMLSAAVAAESVLVVLEECEDALVLDLGTTVLTLPRVDISPVEKDSAKAAAQSENMYFFEPGRESTTVGKNVQRVAEAVVQIQTASGLGFSIPANMQKLFLKNREAFAFDPRNPNALRLPAAAGT